MKSIRLTKIVLALTTIILTGCSDEFLDKQPLSDVTADNFFEKASDLQLYTNTFYRTFPAEGIYNGDERTDNIITNTLSEEMRSARVVPTTGGGWDWTNLRDINYFLENYERCTDEAAKQHYGGVAYFFRAYFYFEKVKRFGDVPWYNYTITAEDTESLQKARDPRQYVIDQVLADLDMAIDMLNEEQEAYTITKYTALALKSRVGLYEGTFEKYRDISGYEQYLNASVEASEELLTNSPYVIYSTGTPEQDYLNLFNAHDAITDEIILSRQFSKSIGVDHNVNYYTTTSSFGKPGMPKRLINSYLNSDGSRFTDIPGYSTFSLIEEATNRDPRMAQTVRTPGYMRVGGTQQLAPNLGATMTGYQIIKYVSESQYDTYDESITDLPLFRLGETALNYAEAKAELGTLTQGDIEMSVGLLRARVGMPTLSVANANANPDPFMEEQYPNVDGTNKGVILEIRRERRIELYMENFRWDDIARWKSGSALTMPLRGINLPGAGSYDLDGNGSTDLVLYEGDAPGNQQAGVQYFRLNSDIYLDNENNIDPHPDFNNRTFNENKDYLYPIPLTELQLNPNLTQNPGW